VKALTVAPLLPASPGRAQCGDTNPWHFAATAYEAAKFGATLSALPKLRYRQGLEVGCSIGVLTEKLARRCHSLLAVDMVELALDQARRRCAGAPGVAFARMRLPDELPEGQFDLILLSEVAYYWSVRELDRVAAFAERALEPGGDIVLVHWIGDTDYPLSGDGAAQRFVAATSGFCRVLHQARREHYRIDVLQRQEQIRSPGRERDGAATGEDTMWQLPRLSIARSTPALKSVGWAELAE
jgi:SAM-dependent methyltransferase